MASQPEELLIYWRKSLSVISVTHYESAKPLNNANYLLGVPSTTLSIIVGTSIFATLQSDVNINIKIATGLISILAAVLAGLQTFLRYEERAEKHRATAARCSTLGREIDELLAFASRGEKITKKQVDAIRMQYEKITFDAPTTSDKMYDKARASLNKQYKSEKVNKNS
jgi:hypothetical protein